MNIARTLSAFRQQNGGNLYRKFTFSSVNRHSSQPQVQEEKFDFEDLKILERTERRKAKINPFMKNVFVSIFNRELLAYPEIINKEESEALDRRIDALEKVFSDPEKSKDDRKKALIGTNMYGAPVNLTNGGLAINLTESLRYLDVISSDADLGQEISDHWVSLQALKIGLDANKYQQVIDDLITGDKTVALCIKEKIAQRLSQADFRTFAELDSQSVWRVTGEKVCYRNNGYYLVLCALEADRLKAFLIHPGAEGISFNDTFVTFKNTPATPLEEATDESLARALSVSRLHAATLCRATLRRGLTACVDYCMSRSLSGKLLSELPTLRSIVGDALVTLYASESADYFTAGLYDDYMDPDTELEMAMCRNFMTTRGLPALLNLISSTSLEQPQLCNQLLNDMRHLTTHGETLDGINMFIALTGIHHAGKMLNQEIKQIRNPLFYPNFVMKKIFTDRLQEKDDPKLTLYLAEHLHPSLRKPSENLEYCVLRMRFACETLMARHGKDVLTAHTDLNRLAAAATEILAMSAVLARASRAYCIGLRNAEDEMKLAACFVEQSKNRVKRLILEITDGEFLNLDHFTIQFGRKVFDTRSTVVEKPTARTFW